MMSASIFSPVLPISVKDLGWAIGYSLRAQFSFHLDNMMSFPRRLTKREAVVSAVPSGKESWWQQNDFCPIEVEMKKLRTLRGQLRSTLLASLLCLCLCVCECFSLVGKKKCQTACEITTLRAAISHHPSPWLWLVHRHVLSPMVFCVSDLERIGLLCHDFALKPSAFSASQLSHATLYPLVLSAKLSHHSRIFYFLCLSVWPLLNVILGAYLFRQ